MTSPARTVSPSCTSHSTSVPSDIDTPSLGMLIGVATDAMSSKSWPIAKGLRASVALPGMSVVADPNVDEPGPPSSSDDTGGEGEGPGEPWWHQPWRLLVLGAALLLLGVTAGWAVASRTSSDPGAGSV